ncbi:MAG: hypothetical protein ABR909_04455 [Candidatus Bathyarchaeia archaeon]|jgi:hypothetical protein
MKRKLLVASFALILAVIAVLSAYQIITPSYSNTVSSKFFTKGRDAPYAAGSSVSCEITMPKTAVLTGSFITNNSVSFYILTSEEYSEQSPSFSGSISYYYTTGDVSSAMVNVTLPAATYYLLFAFKSSSETIPTAENVTGIGSNTGIGSEPVCTMLSITQSFVATSIS